MKNVNALLFTALLLLSFESLGYSKKPALKGGFGAAAATVTTREGQNEDRVLGGSMHTQYGYRFTDWEFNLASYIFFGKVSGMQFHAQDTELEGEGVLESISYGPLFKYITQKEIQPGWRLYFAGGPIWALQTLRLDEFEVNEGEFKKDYKIAYTSRGFQLSLGVEEMLPFKDMHPAYIEVVYQYLRAYRVEIIDASDSTEVETLVRDKVQGRAFGHILMINIGMTIF